MCKEIVFPLFNKYDQREYYFQLWYKLDISNSNDPSNQDVTFSIPQHSAYRDLLPALRHTQEKGRYTQAQPHTHTPSDLPFPSP